MNSFTFISMEVTVIDMYYVTKETVMYVHQVRKISICIPNIYEITLHTFLLHAYLQPFLHKGGENDMRGGGGESVNMM